MREIVHVQAGQCGNQIGSKVRQNPGINLFNLFLLTKMLTETHQTYLINSILSPYRHLTSVTIDLLSCQK